MTFSALDMTDMTKLFFSNETDGYRKRKTHERLLKKWIGVG